MGPSNISFFSFKAIFHFQDYGRKGISMYTDPFYWLKYHVHFSNNLSGVCPDLDSYPQETHAIHGTNGIFTYMNGWFLW